MQQPWSDLQSRFAAAVVDPLQPVPAGIVGRHGSSSCDRFAVHRNNVMMSLVEALRGRFPAICRLVGEEFFRAMARCYAGDHLPTSPLLMEYGASLPEFIEQFAPADSVPYLADVARLEAAWSEAYHAPEAAPLELDELRRSSPEMLAGASVQLHPSVRLLRSSHPVAAIWAAQQLDAVPPLASWEAEDVLVLRPGASVSVHTLAGGTYEFLAALINHDSITCATEAALLAAPQFDAGQRLLDLVCLGAVTGLLPCRRRSHQPVSRLVELQS